MSWAPEVLVDGQWSRNQLRFNTKQEADDNARDLFERWTSTDSWRSTESTDPVNCNLNEGPLRPVKATGA